VAALIEQLLAGRDFAHRNQAAAGMQNFVYLVGDREKRECLLVDPAWDIAGLVEAARQRDLSIVGALVTHYHPDHVGGSIFGIQIEGLAELMTAAPCRVHVHRAEAEGVRKVTGLSKSDLVEHDSGDRVRVGDVEIELLHTPGHTPGSQCFRLRDSLISGDTLFLEGCGRVDLPGGDPDEMYRTLTERLGALPEELVLYPGHAYGGDSAPLAEVRRSNPYLRIPSLGEWRRLMSR
jgi:glyoxylase-like metal-dependent hydrolase (beta-lactamase superfamily II)